MMRIAHVIPAITVGGLWRHLEAISRLEGSQVDSLVISIFDRDVPELVSNLKIPVVQIGMDLRSYEDIELIRAKIRGVLEDFAPAVLHSYHLYSDIYALPLTPILGCKGIRAVHGITQVEYSDPFSRRKVKTDWPPEDLAQMKRLSLFCSLTLVVSMDLKTKLLNHGFDGGKIEVVHPGVDLDRFRWRKRSRAGREAIIGFLGRLEPVKNPGLFIDIASQCIERGFDGQFWLIGDGRLRDFLHEEIERRGLSRRIVMKAETIDIAPLLAELDILLVPSLSEGLPLSILEAMAVGVPVIASKVGGVPEVIENGRNGFLCSEGNPGEFVEHILELLSDFELRNDLAQRARSLVEKEFSIDKHLQGMMRAYGMLECEK